MYSLKERHNRSESASSSLLTEGKETDYNLAYPQHAVQHDALHAGNKVTLVESVPADQGPYRLPIIEENVLHAKNQVTIVKSALDDQGQCHQLTA